MFESVSRWHSGVESSVGLICKTHGNPPLTSWQVQRAFLLVSSMKRTWQFLSLILLALMVPASVCCLGSQQVANEECGCCSNRDKERDAPAQPEACPSDTIARSQLPAPVIMPEMPMMELTGIIYELMRLNELAAMKVAPVCLMTTAPPELRPTWVFVSRAALPARAPSDLA